MYSLLLSTAGIPLPPWLASPVDVHLQAMLYGGFKENSGLCRHSMFFYAQAMSWYVEGEGWLVFVISCLCPGCVTAGWKKERGQLRYVITAWVRF